MENQLYGYMVFECFFSMRNRDPWDDGDDDDDDDDDPLMLHFIRHSKRVAIINKATVS